jgi:hypothetical protein
MTRRTRRRIVTTAVAPASVLAAWALIRLVGIDLEVSVGDGIVGPADVGVAALVGALGVGSRRGCSSVTARVRVSTGRT